MRISGQILINFAFSCVFFIIGFSIASLFQDIASDYSFAKMNVIIGVIGLGTAIFVAINNWRKIPKLFFDNILQYSEKDPFLFPFGKQYFLRIQNEKPDTIAKSVRGFITKDDTKIDYIPLLWKNNLQNKYNIGYKGDLFLFSIEEIETGYRIFLHQ